ncbi:triose-phosphate isomerase, partial [Commensalibacter sp. Nvir]|uniref:triose-phosphate isomerase n=1 Tax=Commensalibacter sp. Nvir TaxID=3069817 RepID=UPI0030C8BF31
LLEYSNTHQNSAPIVICPPFTLLHHVNKLISNSSMKLGAQNCHAADKGAHTGEISAAMIRDTGAKYVILGHSERRKDCHESDETVRQKTSAARKAGLVPIVCIGETKEERDSNTYKQVISRQLNESLPENFEGMIAYEPVWAIGTGISAKNEEIAEVISLIRQKLSEKFGEIGKKITILYGGSVKPNNVSDIYTIDQLGGVLVGGVSLIPEDFIKLIDIAQNFN